jgi:hypothetical protein
MKKALAGIFITRIFFCLVLCGSVLFSGAKGQETEKAELTSFSGNTEVLLQGADEYTAAQEGMVLESQDKIKTSGSSTAELSFNDDNTNLVRLNENTSVQISFSGDEKLAMTEGEIFSSISALPSGSAFEIRTPTAVSGARGTDWVTKVTEEGTDVEALESMPYVRHFQEDGTPSQQVTLINPGQMTTVRKFQKPAVFRPVAEARRQKWQQVKQQVRRNAIEAAIKRQQRPAFNRQDFLKKIKGERSPDKSTSNPPMAESQDKAGVFVSREGERHYPEKSTPKPEAGQQDSSGVFVSREGERQSSQPQAEKEVPAEQKVNKEGKNPAGGQPQPKKAGSAKQDKPSLKNAVAPEASKGTGGKR